MGPEEEIFNDGGGDGESQDLMVVPATEGTPESCLSLTWPKSSEFTLLPASRDPVIQPAERGFKKGRAADHSDSGCLQPPDNDFPCVCISPSPRLEVWRGFLSAVVPFLSTRNPGKKEKPFPIRDLIFLLPYPLGDLERQQETWESTCVPEGTASCHARPSL